MSTGFLTEGLELWKKSKKLSDAELHDAMQAYVREHYTNAPSQKSRMSKLKMYIKEMVYTNHNKRLDLRITKLGMKSTVKEPSTFILGGFKIYEANKDSDDLKDKLIEYTSNTFPNVKTRNTSFISLKKAIATKYSDKHVLDFKLPMNMYDEAFTIDKASVKAKSENCDVINNADKIFQKLLSKVKSDEVEGLLPAVLLATGRRLKEITQTGTFKPTDDEYVAIFSGQLKTDDSKPYKIPLMLPTTVINTALKKIRTTLESHPQYGTSSYASKYITMLFGTKISAHQLRAIYATAMYQHRGAKFESYSEPAYVSMILGHNNMDTVPHYVCWTINGLTKVQFGVISRINHNKQNKAEVKCVANIEKLTAEGSNITQNALRKLGSSPIVIKRVFKQNPGKYK
jgi:integrase